MNCPVREPHVCLPEAFIRRVVLAAGSTGGVLRLRRGSGKKQDSSESQPPRRSVHNSSPKWPKHNFPPNQIEVISLKKFPICRSSRTQLAEVERGGGGGGGGEVANLEKPDKGEERRSERSNSRSKSAKVRARTWATRRLECLAAISQSQERWR